jgi:succinate semialdehyde reductase
MFTIKQPSKIIFGKNTAHEFQFPKKSLVITSSSAKSRNWFSYTGIDEKLVFDSVKPNPSMETVEEIILHYQNSDFDYVIGIGGGSVLDVSKYVGFKLNKPKISVPTTFGSGSEITRISVLKINGKKKSFHDDGLISDVSIIDSNFLSDTPHSVYRNSAIDACAQCSEAYDSKSGNIFTKFLCSKAFDYLEDGILNDSNEKLAFGSLLTGLGFGNSSTTLGHALSYPFSNEGLPHGHALAFTTVAAHNFNKSRFFERFKNLVKKLDFPPISLKQNLNDAADIIMTDREHLDNNPKKITKKNVHHLLECINENKANNFS